jgi:hypothetical protein
MRQAYYNPMTEIASQRGRGSPLKLPRYDTQIIALNHDTEMWVLEQGGSVLEGSLRVGWLLEQRREERWS